MFLSKLSALNLDKWMEKTKKCSENDLIEVLNNPHLTISHFVRVLAFLVPLLKKDEIKHLINHKFMDSQHLDTLFGYCIKTEEQLKLILNSPFLDEYLYLKIITLKPYGILKELLESKYAKNEVLYFAITKPNITDEEWDLIISNPWFDSVILSTMLRDEKLPVNNNLLVEILNQNFVGLNEKLQIFAFCMKYIYLLDETIQYILKDIPQCISEEEIAKYACASVDNMKYVLDNNLLSENSIRILVDGCYPVGLPSVACYKEIIKSSIITDEILLTIINAPLDLIPEANAKTQIIEAILEINNLSENILVSIVSISKSERLVEKASNHPNAGVIVKARNIMSSMEITKENIDKLLNEGASIETIRLLLNKNFSIEVVTYILDNPNVNDEIYKEIIDVLRKHKNEQGQSFDITDYIKKLLEKDLSEDTLCYIIKHFCYIDLIKKVVEHPNAGFKVITIINIIADLEGMDGKTFQKIADELKRKKLKEMFVIEEEKNATEMLRVNVEDGMSTMLWGPSGVGKTSRVFQVDPTATMLILKNGMLPEEVVGGKEPNGNPGEIYPPHWYVLLCEKCEKEPDRKHILFIDEFTNVSDTIKNLVWEIIGNRLVNGHEEWPLPQNCSIVVAGNRPTESSAVKIDAMGGVMPAPLHNRIDSMIEIEFDIDEWQKWALETNSKTGNLNIHPIVYSFCVSHADKVMFTDYEPNDVTKPFLTPRKWETLSKAIFAAEKRGANNHISYTRIKSILGEGETAIAFIEHYERMPIDMNKIIMGKYKAEDFPSSEDKLYALGCIISGYNGDYITIENFILECLGDEYLSVYNNMKSVRNALVEISKSKTNDESVDNGSKLITV